MLEKIVIDNVCSIGHAEMDFVKGNYKFLDENILENVVNPIALYGHNGSGKSSFINAMAQFTQLMIAPAADLKGFMVNNFSLTYYQNNRTTENERKIVATIKLFFMLGKRRYEYSISTSAKGFITAERLIRGNEIVFRRFVGSYLFKGKKNDIPKSSRLIPTLRVLASEEISHIVIQSVYAYLSSFTLVNMTRIATGRFVIGKPLGNWGKLGNLTSEKSDEVKEYLKRNNDFPYYSIRKKETVANNANGSPLADYYLEMEDGDWRGNLPMDYASDGMMSNSALLSIVLAVPKNSVIFIDEIEVALHPSTIKAYLDVVREKKIQVVFTSHNTNILQDLRPDQVYFAKWSKGYSTIKRLSDIYPNIREVNNIEKMYLSHIFDEVIDGEED